MGIAMSDRTPGAVTKRCWPLLAFALAACGGGGGTRSDPPPSPPPPPPPDPPPTVVEPRNPAYSRHLTWTGADAAHEAGLTGAGIGIGVVDSGVNRNHPSLRGRVTANLTYINPNTNNLSVDDVVGHGTAVAQIIAGQPFGQWPGGIAPGAQIVSARIISDKPPEDDGSGEGNEVDGALGLAPIHQDLINRGVRIMNNSWGGLYWNNPNATAPIAGEYRPFIVDHGGLVVFSTGNAGFADPSDMSALPSQLGPGGTTPAADLERGWLAVAALDADDPRRLATYSNACGLAMHYCLVAPGTVVVTGTSDAPDKPEYWRWSGTSFSAPIVSGAAALVWEAFPYFDNDQVRQTLLGTASDLGDPGVDAVFGHGALDIAAAVRGPARLDWGDMVVDFAGTSVWRNALTGDGAIVKRGPGTLILEEHAWNSGGLRVEEGQLRVTGFVAGDTSVLEAGTFGLGAGVQGNLDNNGRVELLPGPAGEAEAQSTVSGAYRQAADAVLALELGHFLFVGRTADIEGGELHILGVKDGYTSGSRERIMATAGGLSGRFDSLTWASSIFLQGSLDYDAFDLWLDITRLDVNSVAKSLPGITAAGLSAARRIEHAFGRIDAGTRGGDGSISDGFIRIAGEFQGIGDETEARTALDSLSGESHSLATSLTFDAIDMERRGLSARWGALASGDDPGGAWKQALGHGGSTGFAGGGFALDGWTIGRDQALANGLVAGFAFGETRADDRVGGNRDRSRDRQTQANFYLGRLFDDGYAAAHAGVGRFDRDIERRLFAGEGTRAGVFGAYSGSFSNFGIEAGRHHRLGELRVTPHLGADHVRLDSDGFREWGSGFALQAREAAIRRTQAIAGLRAALDWRGARLHAYSEWQQTLAAEGFDVDASFVGVDSWSPLPMADAAKSGGLFGMGIDAWLGRSAQLSLGLDRRFGPRGDERMASLRYIVGF